MGKKNLRDRNNDDILDDLFDTVDLTTDVAAIDEGIEMTMFLTTDGATGGISTMSKVRGYLIYLELY